MTLNLGPRPPGDPDGMRALARVYFQAADDMQTHAAGARRQDLGFTGPAAKRIAARVTHWLADVDRDAEGLRGVARRLVQEAGGVEQSQHRYDKAVARELLADKPR
ncbi:MAG: hypothetical protein QOG15_665 [Solirubrobacteraceae bacterium]|jgi:hypothetical protein|nr:hypothetical protein [Solirubrobacteraceae bacterium]